MKKRNRMISFMVAASLVIPVLGHVSISVYAQESQKHTDEKSYIIVLNDEVICDEATNEMDGTFLTDDSVVLDNEIIVAELTEQEAKELAHNKNVLVEEDIVLSASTTGLLSKPVKAKEEKLRRSKEDLTEQNTEQDTDVEQEYDWNLQAIHADTLISEEEQADVKVAVLDSGVDYVEGIDLAGYVNFVDEEEEIPEIFQDLTGHGTGIAGIIAGNGQNGIYGVDPNASLYSVKVLDDQNTAPLSRIIEGIYWCIEHDIDIINMSFGTPVYSKALQHAVEDAYAANILMIGAAGNDGETVEYPAAFEEVMAVAASSPSAEISKFSNTKGELEIAAPGEKIRTASFFNGSMVTHGTSIAVPHVVGVASLLWKKDLSKSNEFIRQLLRYSAKDIDSTDACGLLDAEYAFDIYDDFSKNFDMQEGVQKDQIPENVRKPECFESIEKDEAYVEGRWGEKGHKDAIIDESAGLSAEAIAIIKMGAVYPDKNTDLTGARYNPRWHGRWAYSIPSDTANYKEVNYAAAFEMVTSIAIEGGNTSYYSSYSEIFGMDSSTFKAIKADINQMNNAFGSILSPYANTKANRKYFLYGCAIHLMTDLFAHSTTRTDGVYLGHQYKYTDQTDNVKSHPKRYKIAVRAAKYSLQNLLNNSMSDGKEIARALKDLYTETTEFKVINLKKYMSENGYPWAVTSLANINAGSVAFVK